MNLVETGIRDVILKELSRYDDRRGWLMETHRMDEINHLAAMSYISLTRPGVARGPHEHRLQTDYFVFAGPGSFDVYLYDNRPESSTCRASFSLTLGEERPAALLVPPRVIHAYRCVSTGPGVVINLPDRLYRGCGKGEPVDEVRHENDPSSPFYAAFDRALFTE
ncbi:MAG: dTDP-4-dehydrorhamnose 3,5-epimerase family protein [Candidatus Sumerlaeota bacterium]|nr:dTDP-4-dehydrorhamnose 3,5-epimerase family protein [Candidatus Sumerlaeota bacterium]